MKLVNELLAVNEDLGTQVGPFNLRREIEMAQKIDNHTYTRDEVMDAYVMGFTSGDLVVDENPYYNTRQGLFSRLDTHRPNYAVENKRNRKNILEVLKYYKGFYLIEQTGDIEPALQQFKQKKTLTDYYIEKGGKRDIWSNGSETASKYVGLFGYCDQDKTVEAIISELKTKDESELTDLDKSLMELDDKEINALKAAYGRTKKQRVLELILTGHSKETIIKEYPMSDRQFDKHYDNTKRQVIKFATKHQGKTNLNQWVKRDLKVVGDADRVINAMLRESNNK